jgi:hypothetical protein
MSRQKLMKKGAVFRVSGASASTLFEPAVNQYGHTQSKRGRHTSFLVARKLRLLTLGSEILDYLKIKEALGRIVI